MYSKQNKKKLLLTFEFSFIVGHSVVLVNGYIFHKVMKMKSTIRIHFQNSINDAV